MNARLAGQPAGRAWLLVLALLLALLAGCETMQGEAAPRVKLVGVEPLPREGLELRFAVRLRVQNPSDRTIEFDGVALDLEVNGKGLASGVSDQRGSVPRFGETIVTVPVSISAFAAVRQAMGFADGTNRSEIPFVVSGRLAGTGFASVRFSDSGTLKLPQ